MDALLRQVRAARRRLIAGRLAQELVYGLIGALAAGALLAWIGRFTGPLPALPIAAALAGLALAGAVVRVAARPVTMRTAALALDRAAGSHERILTALSIGEAASPAGEAVLRDAFRIAASLDAGAVAIDRPRRASWMAAPLLVALAGLWIPVQAADPADPSAAFDDPNQPPLPVALRKDQAMKLHRRAFELERRLLDRNAPATKELAESMKQTAEAIRKNELKPAEAMARISSLEEKLRQRREELGKSAALAPHFSKGGSGQAGGPAPAESRSRRAEELAEKLAALDRQLEEAMKAMGRGGPKGDPHVRRDALKNVADLLRSLEGDDLRKLEEMLGDLAETEGVDPEEAAKALEALEEELDELAEGLDEWDALDEELAELEGMKRAFGGPGSGPGDGLGRGDGRGPRGTHDPNDPTRPTRPPSSLSPGQIIGSIQFKTLPGRGELQSAYAEAHQAATIEAADALEQQDIPPAYRSHVRDYFESIRPDRK